MQILCVYNGASRGFMLCVLTCLHMFVCVLWISVQGHCSRLWKLYPAVFRLSLCYFSVCLCCCWMVRVDANVLSCWYTQPDPAETPLVTVVMIKHCYNWFTALFSLSVWRERFRLPSLCQRAIRPTSLAAGTVKERILRINFQESVEKN